MINLHRIFFFTVFCTTLILCRDWDKINSQQYCIADHKDNTPCETQCAIGKNCGESISNFVDLTMREKQLVMNIHNELRESVARGDYADYHFPEATNMYVLNYDDECEFMTACWLRQCNFWHDKHFKVDGTKFGQNLHMKWQRKMKKEDLGDAALRHGIQAWFDEYKMLKDHPGIYKSYQPVPKTGHFTALIWHEAKQLGCAKEHFKLNDKEYYYLFCNYYPASNWMNSPIYSTEPYECARSERYPHLCGEVKDLIPGGGQNSTGVESLVFNGLVGVVPAIVTIFLV